MRKLFTLIVLLQFFSCSDSYLDVTPVNEPTPENFYKTKEQMEKALNAAYSALGNRGMYGWWLGVTRMVMSDDTETVEANVIDHHNFSVTDTNIRLFNRSNGNGLWNSLYIGILRCNLVITKLPTSEIKLQEDKDRILGQALFLRALYYFHLVNYWGEVPLLLDDNYNAIDLEKSSVNDVYAAIENDLNLILANNLLPTIYNGSAGQEIGRATKGAVLSLLGKTLLYQNKFDLAKNHFQSVVSSNTYSLVNVNNIWTVAADNGTESVFEVQFANAKAGINPFFDDGVQAAEITLRNQTIAPNQYNGWENAWPSQDLLDVFETGDLRRQAFIVMENEFFPTQSTAYNPSKNRGNFAIRKGINSGWSTGSPNGTGEENFPIIRYSDVLLMYAETLIRSNSPNIPLAENLIDQVRARAFGLSVTALRSANLGIATYATDNNKSLFEALKDERRREFCFEGHRFNDLARWDDAKNNTILLDRGYNQSKRYYPLSREDLDLSNLFN